MPTSGVDFGEGGCCLLKILLSAILCGQPTFAWVCNLRFVEARTQQVIKSYCNLSGVRRLKPGVDRGKAKNSLIWTRQLTVTWASPETPGELCSAGRWCDSCCTEKHPLFRNREQDVLLKFWGACSVRQMPRMTLYSAECTESPHASASLARCCRLAETLLFLRRLIPVTTSLWSATPW